MSKLEPHEIHHCAGRGGHIKGETTLTRVALEGKGLAVCGCCVVVHQSQVYDRSDGKEDGLNEDR